MKEENLLNHIKELCEERNWSLYQLAKQSGISYSTVNNLFHRQLFTVQLAAYPYRVYLGNIDSSKLVSHSLDFYNLQTVYAKFLSNGRIGKTIHCTYIEKKIVCVYK